LKGDYAVGNNLPLRPIVDYGKYKISEMKLKVFSEKWAQATCPKYALNAEDAFINITWLPWDGLIYFNFEEKLKFKMKEFVAKLERHNDKVDKYNQIAKRAIGR